jgi:hypothetical protein
MRAQSGAGLPGDRSVPSRARFLPASRVGAGSSRPASPGDRAHLFIPLQRSHNSVAMQANSGGPALAHIFLHALRGTLFSL